MLSDSRAVEEFVAKAESILYFHPRLLASDKKLFREFHDVTVNLAQQREYRQCCRALVVDNKPHPIVIYSLHRGTFLGSRITKLCSKCKIYEHRPVARGGATGASAPPPRALEVRSL